MAERQVEIKLKLNVKNICLVFFKWMAFSPFHTPSSELRQHGSCMIYRKTASITERITVVLAIPYTTTMGGGDNHTHSSTYHRQTSFYFPCNTRHSLFIKQWEQLRLKWKEPIHNGGDSLYIEITCACSIGNKVLVIGNRNVRFFSPLMARLRHCILKPMPASHDHAMNEAIERSCRQTHTYEQLCES